MFVVVCCVLFAGVVCSLFVGCCLLRCCLLFAVFRVSLGVVCCVWFDAVCRVFAVVG